MILRTDVFPFLYALWIRSANIFISRCVSR